MVEADGEWHTSDNKYGSAGWKAAHAPAAPKQTPLSPRKSPPKPSIHLNGTNPDDSNGKRKADVEIVVLDSDDEDEEGRVKRELSPSIGSGSSAAINRSMESASLSANSHSQLQADVIDLTLDSDEDEPLSLTRTAEKRKAPENGLPSPTEQIWKKARVEAIPPAVMMNVNGHANGVHGSSHVNGTISPSALNALHMQPLHYDPLRDAQRTQSSMFTSRPPSVPRPPTVTSPTLRFGNPAPFRNYLGSNSPPPPPPPPPRPRQPSSSGGHLTPRGRDFSSFGGASSSRWP
jgi:E3 SUMO-protein ligase PIAS1